MMFRILLKKASNLVYKILLLHVYKKAKYKNILFTDSNFIIITIAFNNIEVLKTQYKFLKKNLENDFNYVIADNSSDKDTSSKTRLFCEENKISYIKLPHNPLTGLRASGSHGIALNWAYHNIVQKYKPAYFGFLDHDIFPLQKTNIIEKMRSGYFGIIRMRFAPYWYFWPGFSFFKYSEFKKYTFNFSPYHAGQNGLTFLDTGGANYYSISKKINRESLAQAKSILIDLSTEKTWVLGADTRSTFEIIDKIWLHMRQISWREESSNKMKDSREMLRVAHKNML